VQVLALVPAAGEGLRLGLSTPKALVALGGLPLVVRAVRGLLDSGVVDTVLVAVRPADLGLARVLLAGDRVDVVPGGADRTASVRAALEHGLRTHPDTRTVLVHDAARALTPAALIRDVVAAVEATGSAVIPVLPLADTVKEVGPDGAVRATADRSVLRAVQTPQGFPADVLRRAYARAGDAATDDAGLVERLGEPVRTVPGDPLAFKVTTRWDLSLAEYLVGAPLREAP
jgi:2-C-methyl-D-erythritol 4-phosphate cytidylyltransferase